VVCDAENIVDGVVAGGLIGDPACGVDGPASEDIAVLAIVSEFKSFAGEREVNGVRTDDCSGAENVDVSFIRMVGASFSDGCAQKFCGAGWGIFLGCVVCFEEVDIGTMREMFCGEVNGGAEDGDTDGGVGCDEHGDVLCGVLRALKRVVGESGGADKNGDFEGFSRDYCVSGAGIGREIEQDAGGVGGAHAVGEIVEIGVACEGEDVADARITVGARGDARAHTTVRAVQDQGASGTVHNGLNTSRNVKFCQVTSNRRPIQVQNFEEDELFVPMWFPIVRPNAS
jgi:hypothetical protein